MGKIGRNDPCPCGSGLKYKKCCLAGNEEESVYFRKLEGASDHVLAKLSDFFRERLSSDVYWLAYQTFFLEHEDKDEPLQLVELFRSMFWNWVFYVWEPDAEELEECESEDCLEPGKTIAEQFLEKVKPDLEEMERVAVSKINRAPFSFFEVDRVHSQSFEIQDMFFERTFRIWDNILSDQIETGDIIYANPVEVGDFAFLPGLSPVKLGPGSKGLIYVTGDDLREKYEGSEYFDKLVDSAFREVFLDMYFDVFDMSEDADDEEGGGIFMRRSIYDIQSPEAAFEALYTLSCVSKEKLYSTAKLGEDGQLKWIGVPCFMEDVASEDCDVDSFLGNIFIKEHVLEIETPSEENEEFLKMEVEERIGDQAVYRTDEIEEIDPESLEYDDPEWEEE